MAGGMKVVPKVLERSVVFMGDQKQGTTLHSCVCRLKWFNESKGFGFLVPEGSSTPEINGKDAFVHVSALQSIGVTYLGQGALFDCTVSMSEKGLFVEHIESIVEEGDTASHKVKIPLPPEVGESYELCGRVKWYRLDKGYGFVAGEDGKKDIFVHQTALRRNGINDEKFDKGAEVRMSVRDVDQGREAVEITLVGNQNIVSEDKAPISEGDNADAVSRSTLDVDTEIDPATIAAQIKSEI
jgi:CspA family cold shock protein